MILENSPTAILSVDLNIRGSRKWAMPDTPLGSSAEPTLYHTMWVTTGARWSGMTTTSMPLASVNSVARGSARAEASGSADASIVNAIDKVERRRRPSLCIQSTPDQVAPWVSPPKSCTALGRTRLETARIVIDREVQRGPAREQ